MIRGEKIVRKGSLHRASITWRIHYETPKRKGYEDFSSRSEATAFAVEILGELLDTVGI